MSLLKSLAISAAVVATGIVGATQASAGTFASGARIARADAAVVRVHADGYRDKRRYHRQYYRDDVVVDAPTTYVETRGRRTWVDAPFTAVRVHPEASG